MPARRSTSRKSNALKNPEELSGHHRLRLAAVKEDGSAELHRNGLAGPDHSDAGTGNAALGLGAQRRITAWNILPCRKPKTANAWFGSSR
jgi:hypothetical protein